jgi:hypothetical protein
MSVTTSMSSLIGGESKLLTWLEQDKICRLSSRSMIMLLYELNLNR